MAHSTRLRAQGTRHKGFSMKRVTRLSEIHNNNKSSAVGCVGWECVWRYGGLSYARYAITITIPNSFPLKILCS